LHLPADQYKRCGTCGRQCETQRTTSKPRNCAAVTSALQSVQKVEDSEKKYNMSTRALIWEWGYRWINGYLCIL